MAGQLDKAAAAHDELLGIYGGYALSHCEIGLIYQEMGSPPKPNRSSQNSWRCGLRQTRDCRKWRMHSSG